MIFPDNFEQKLGFDHLRHIMHESCSGPLGQRLVAGIHFSEHQEEIKLWLAETEEYRQICISESRFPNPEYFDLSQEIQHLNIEGTYLDTESLLYLKASLQSLTEILKFFKKANDQRYPLLKTMASNISIDLSLIAQIEAIVDDKGKVRDSASQKLGEIRKELIIKRWDVDEKVNKVLKQAKKSGWTEDDLEVTIRNGRTVIPMAAMHKRKIKGFVHDESATGHTVYIEPEDVFETNNEIRELELNERREIVRILQAFADQLRPQLGSLREAYGFLGQLDFLNAKAQLALKIGAIQPRLEGSTCIDWQKAIHPLLYLSHKVQKKEVVPLNIHLDGENRILIISGPNAGGKSVCLKTIGLLQYMLQCGLPIPVMEGSTASIFRKILLDIGDEQSLENDLSTYSSHLNNMSRFLSEAGPDTLFLIDEFGSGTEPQSGGAIAEAILEELNRKHAFGVITTHYANLKILAGKKNGIINGAMLFDREKMEPLFKLEMGKPGSSFAFEIAGKSGMREDILNSAREKVGKKQLDFDRQLAELEEEKKSIEKKSTEFRFADDLLFQTIEKYEKLVKDLENSRNDILSKARAEARRLLDDSNKIIEKTIKDIREQQAEKETTKALRTVLEEKKKEVMAALQAEDTSGLEPLKKITVPSSKNVPLSMGVNEIQQPLQPVKKEITPPSPKPALKSAQTMDEPDLVDPGPLETGTWVKMSGQTAIGRIENLKGNDALVSFGSVIVKCKKSLLEKASRKEISYALRVEPSGIHAGYIKDINQKAANFPFKIDLRGKRAEEAMNELAKYLDEALLLGIFEVRILHGKGDGILRSLVRQYLATLKGVKVYRDEVLELGGHGITVVNFR